MKAWTEQSSNRALAGLLTVLLVLAAGALWAAGSAREGAEAESQVKEATGSWVVDAHLDRRAPREPKGLVLEKGGWKYDCMECHRMLEAKWHLEYPLMEHKGVELKHGSNRFCLNCHHPENRNAFVDYDGSEIAESDVVMLCGKCHGPQYRDWKIGAHGRENGYWNASMGETEKLRCIQCHDPHDPAFKAMEPLPAPAYPSRAAGKKNEHPEHGEEPEHGE